MMRLYLYPGDVAGCVCIAQVIRQTPGVGTGIANAICYALGITLN